VTVSDAAGSFASTTCGTLPTADQCSAEDGTTCADISSSVVNVGDNIDVVVSTSSEQPMVSKHTQSTVCCIVVVVL